MSVDYVVKTVPATDIVARTATLEPEVLGEHIGPMFDAVARALGHAPDALDAPIATYTETESGMAVAVGYANPGPAPEGTEGISLPAVTAVCGVHLGPIDGIRSSWRDLHRWVLDNRYTFAGPCREWYVRAEADNQADTVTELQQPVTRA